MPKGPAPRTDQGQPQPLHGLKLVIKEEALPLKEQPEFPALALLASRGLLAPDAWKCKGAQVSLKATIDVPMLGTIIEQNGDGLLEDSHMPVGWPLHIDGAVRQCCIHRSATLQELDDMLGEYDMKRDSVEIRPHRRCWGVIFRMALVKRLQVYLGGGPFFVQNLLFLIGRDARLQKTL